MNSALDSAPAPKRFARQTDMVPFLQSPGEWGFREQSRPEPAAGEIRIEMKGCGVCASGLPTWEGREWFSYPLEPGQLGHEGWGVIDAVGAGVDPGRLGEEVVVWADGAYAPWLCVNADEAVPIPSILSGQPLPIEPLGCAVNVLRRSQVAAGMPVAVVGVGFLGALLIQLLRAAGCEVHAVARRPFAQEIARRAGAHRVVPWGEPHEVADRLERVGHSAFPRVIEAVGVASSLDLASSLVETGGKLVIAGYHQDGLRSINLQDWNWKGIDVINAHERDSAVIRAGIDGAIDALKRGDLDPRLLLTHRYSVLQLDEAYRDLARRPEGFLKGWIDFTLNPQNP